MEVFHDGEWGTVCGDGFGIEEARVVCVELGFPHIDVQVVTHQFGYGEGSIWLDHVLCDGSEDELLECEHPAWGSSDCAHREDVGVICGGKWN